MAALTGRLAARAPEPRATTIHNHEIDGQEAKSRSFVEFECGFILYLGIHESSNNPVSL
jgi:hypothetical protein